MPLLRIENLRVRFETPDGTAMAVNGVDLALEPGECLGIVGESGSGKTQTFLAAMGLLESNGRAEGSIRLGDQELLGASPSEWAAIRGRRMAMIFQDPLTALTPHLTLGRQLTEVPAIHDGIAKAAARRAALEMLERVGISDPERRFDAYPHELSGGMRQRALVAMALLGRPDLLIADEPTTALDVTVQAQILDLLAELRHTANTAIVLITHDLGVVAGLCDRVAVMYAGRIVESGPVEQLFADPRHPYTLGLLLSIPRMDRPVGGSMATIPGQPPEPHALPAGCAFWERCSFREPVCREDVPPLEPVEEGRAKACHLAIN